MVILFLLTQKSDMNAIETNIFIDMDLNMNLDVNMDYTNSDLNFNDINIDMNKYGLLIFFWFIR